MSVVRFVFNNKTMSTIVNKSSTSPPSEKFTLTFRSDTLPVNYESATLREMVAEKAVFSFPIRPALNLSQKMVEGSCWEVALRHVTFSTRFLTVDPTDDLVSITGEVTNLGNVYNFTVTLPIGMYMEAKDFRREFDNLMQINYPQLLLLVPVPIEFTDDGNNTLTMILRKNLGNDRCVVKMSDQASKMLGFELGDEFYGSNVRGFGHYAARFVFDPFVGKRIASLQMDQVDPRDFIINPLLTADQTVATLSLFSQPMDDPRLLTGFDGSVSESQNRMMMTNETFLIFFLVSLFTLDIDTQNLEFFPLSDAGYLDKLKLSIFHDAANTKPYYFVGYSPSVFKVDFRLRNCYNLFR